MGSRKGGQWIIALDASTQRELWALKVCDKGGEPRCTPTVEGGLVFAVGTDGDLVCAEAASGREVWRKNYERDFGGKMMSGWNYSESPLVDGARLIVTPGGNDAVLVALDKKTGAEIWRSPLPANMGGKGGDGAGYTGPVISNAAGVRQYVTLVGRGILSVAANDGKALWHYNRVANSTANIPTPLVWDDYVFCSSGYGTGAALLKIVKVGGNVSAPVAADDSQKKVAALTADLARLRDVRGKLDEGTAEWKKADDAVQSAKAEIAKVGGADGAPVSTRALGSPIEAQEQYFLNASTFQNHHGGMVRLGDYIYAGTGHNNGFPICIAWKTGDVVWRKDRGPGAESAAVIAADGLLFFRYQNAVMALIQATPDGYVQKGAFPLAVHLKESWAHPALQSGLLYLRDQDSLMCYDVRSK